MPVRRIGAGAFRSTFSRDFHLIILGVLPPNPRGTYILTFYIMGVAPPYPRLLGLVAPDPTTAPRFPPPMTLNFSQQADFI